jgi:hypothetical protein
MEGIMTIQRVYRQSVVAFIAVLWLAIAGCAQAGVRPEVMRYADMVLVNGKIITVDEKFSIREIRSVMTIVGGKIVYEAGRP